MTSEKKQNARKEEEEEEEGKKMETHKKTSWALLLVAEKTKSQTMIHPLLKQDYLRQKRDE